MIKPPSYPQKPPSSYESAKNCLLCHDQGFVRIEKEGYPFVQRCSCQRKQVFHQILVKSGLPEKFWNTTLASKAVDGREPFIPFGGGRELCSQIRAAANRKALQEKSLPAGHKFMDFEKEL